MLQTLKYSIIIAVTFIAVMMFILLTLKRKKAKPKKKAMVTYKDFKKAYHILAVVCELTNQTLDNLKGNSRKREVVIARHLTAHLIKTNTKLNYRQIGEILNRDHSSIVHSVKTCGDDIDTDKEFRELYNFIKRKL